MKGAGSAGSMLQQTVRISVGQALNYMMFAVKPVTSPADPIRPPFGRVTTA